MHFQGSIYAQMCVFKNKRFPDVKYIYIETHKKKTKEISVSPKRNTSIYYFWTVKQWKLLNFLKNI